MALISLKDLISVSNNGLGLPIDIRQQVDEYINIFDLYQCYPGMRIYVKYDSTSKALIYPKGIYIVKSIYSGTGKPNLVEFIEDYLHISDKVSKPLDTPTAGNFVSFDDNGNAVDSNCNTGSFAPIANAMPLPQQGDEGKILGYEIPEGGTSPTIGWVKKPSDGDDAYHVWLEANGYDEQGHPVSEYNEYNRGKSAREIYNATYNKNLNDAEFAAELKMNYPMLHVGYDSTNAGATVGVPFTGNLNPTGEDIEAGETTMGKLYLMPDAASDPENCIGFVTVLDGQTYKWCNVGAIRIPSDALAKSDVDNECTDGAPDEPASAKVVMDLKAKLEGVTASELKVNAVVGTNVTTDAYVSGETGLLVTPESSASSYAYFELAIPQGTKSIRFATGTKTSSAKIGYSIGYYDENVYVPTRHFYFDVAETTPPTGIVEKSIKVLEGETTFMVTVVGNSSYTSITLDKFYCYLQSGDTIIDNINEVDNKIEGVVDSETVNVNIKENRAYKIVIKGTTTTTLLFGLLVEAKSVSGVLAYKPYSRCYVDLKKGYKVTIRNLRTNSTTCRPIVIAFSEKDDENNTVYRCAANTKTSNYTNSSRDISVIEYTEAGEITISDDSNYSIATFADFNNVDCETVRIYVNFASYDSSSDYIILLRMYIKDSLKNKINDLESFSEDVATDIENLKLRTNEITTKTYEVDIIEDGDDKNVFEDKYICANNGGSISNTGSKYIKIDVEGKKKVRFLGIYPKKNNWKSGYAFYEEDVDNESSIEVSDSTAPRVDDLIESYKWDWNSSLSSSTTKEYTIDIPYNAKIMRITCASTATTSVSSYFDDFYVYIYQGESLEDVIRKYAKTSEEDSVGLDKLSSRLALDAMLNKPIPLSLETTNEGWSKIKSKQLLIMLDKVAQQLKIKWTPRGGDIPSCRKIIYPNGATISGEFVNYENYLAGVTFTSIPYSSNIRDFKTVGIDVSLYTFMTAVHNPYSLMYTECVYGKKVSGAYVYKSAYGRKYENTNGYAYYGTVCCGFTSSVVGAPVKYGNGFHKRIADMLGVFRPMAPAGLANYELLEIGDTFNDNLHSFIITGIKRDESGNINGLLLVESISGGVARNVNSKRISGICRIVEFTESDWKLHFENRLKLNLNASSNPGMYIHYKYVPLGYNLNVEDTSKFITINNEELINNGHITEECVDYEDNVTYNEDICTIYGDKPCLSKGEFFALNYNLNNTANYLYDSINIYKMNDSGEYILQNGDNDTLALSSTISAAQTGAQTFFTSLGSSFSPFNASLENTLENHIYIPYNQDEEENAWGRFLPAGKYRATMYDSINRVESDYTYWEILDDNVIVTKLGEDTYRIKNTFSLSTTTPELYKQTNSVYIYVGISLDDDNGRAIASYSGRPLEYFETRLGEFIVHPKELVRLAGYAEDITDLINSFRIIMKGDYGQAATSAVVFPDILAKLEGDEESESREED